MQEFQFAISPDPARPEPPFHSLVLDAGTWCVSPVANAAEPELMAWNAWSGQVTDCTTPSTCSRGWLNFFRIWSPAFVGAQNLIKESADRNRYESVQLALDNTPDTEFVLPRQAIATFFIDDSYHDDRGGLTLRLRKIA